MTGPSSLQEQLSRHVRVELVEVKGKSGQFSLITKKGEVIYTGPATHLSGFGHENTEPSHSVKLVIIDLSGVILGSL
ncbi:unnamed protein product [Caretta caretta]